MIIVPRGTMRGDGARWGWGEMGMYGDGDE